MRKPIPYEPHPSNVGYIIRFTYTNEEGRTENHWICVSTIEQAASQITLNERIHTGFQLVSVDRYNSLTSEEERWLKHELSEAQRLKIWEPNNEKKG